LCGTSHNPGENSPQNISIFVKIRKIIEKKSWNCFTMYKEKTHKEQQFKGEIEDGPKRP